MTASADPSSAFGRVVEVNGAELYYEEHGSGHPLVLVHGGLGSSAMWQPLLAHLIGDFLVITPDSRGHGRSTNPAGQISYPLLADDMAEFIQVLGLKRTVIGGWSDGGQVALEIGARHPGVASGLIAGAAYPDFQTTGLREDHKEELAVGEDGTPDLAGVDRTLGEFASLVKSWHVGGEKQWRRLVQATVPMWLDYPGLSPNDLQNVTTPTLVLIGDRDESFPVELMLQLFRNLPNAELAVCPQANHIGPLIPDRAGVFAGLIRDFANRCAREE
jgi:pimeloyl-ACP methyl ester carboxylesterase